MSKVQPPVEIKFMLRRPQNGFICNSRLLFFCFFFNFFLAVYSDADCFFFVLL